MYILSNPKTKKEVRTALKAGNLLEVFSPGPYPCPTNGFITVEGPHYPQPHKWYGVAEVKDGIVVSIK